MRKNIKLPHLSYTVKVRPWKPIPSGPGATAWIQRDSGFSCHVYLPKDPSAPVVAHELIHVLQHISECLRIDFIEEAEHFAYLMEYLTAQILNYKLVKKVIKARHS